MNQEDIKLKIKKLKKELDYQKEIDKSSKVTIAGSFGKFGSKYSPIFAPNLLFHVTITGQLILLMLIEQFEANNVQVLSANTDGVTIRVKRSQEQHAASIVQWLEGVTGIPMDEDLYKSCHYRDVNNFIIVKDEGGCKTKGVFAEDGIRKSPANAIVRDACREHIENAIPIELTINKETDICKFLTVKKVTGGAYKDDELLGGTVRFYRSLNTTSAINYVKNGNQVGGSERCNPLMNLPENNKCPEDLDRSFYVRKAHDTLVEIGVLSEYYLWRKSDDDLIVSEMLCSFEGYKTIDRSKYLRVKKKLDKLK